MSLSNLKLKYVNVSPRLVRVSSNWGVGTIQQKFPRWDVFSLVSFVLWYRILLFLATSVSEEFSASIFRIIQQTSTKIQYSLYNKFFFKLYKWLLLKILKCRVTSVCWPKQNGTPSALSVSSSSHISSKCFQWSGIWKAQIVSLRLPFV
jgi:hypothetical protein